MPRMSKKAEKLPPTAVAVATATVVATRTLASTTTAKSDIPKSHPKTLDIPSTPSKAVTANATIPKGDKRSSSATRMEHSQKILAQQIPQRGPCNKEQQKSPQAGAIHPSQFASICREVSQIREEHVAIRKSLSEKDGELGKTRVALRSIAQERDFLRNKVSELEQVLKHSPEMYSHVAAILSSETESYMNKSSPKLKPNGAENPAIIPTTRNALLEQANTMPAAFSSSRTIVHLEQNQKPASSASRPDIVSISSAESPRKCNGNGSHLNKGGSGAEDSGKVGIGNLTSPATVVSSPSPVPPVNSLEAHQATNNNKKLQQKQLQRCMHSNMSHERSEHQHMEFHNGNGRNENGNDIPGMTKSNNNNHGGTGVLLQQHHLSQSGITGLDLMLLGSDCSTKVVEHLVHPVAIESHVREIQHTLVLRGVPLNGDRLREVEIEIDRLNSRMDHLRSQNDVITLNLEDAKSHADRLTVLLGKYESNNVALQLTLRYSDQMTDAYEILVALLETELGQVLANIHAAGHLHSIRAPSTGALSSGSGNNNNSNDNSPSDVLPPNVASPPTTLPSVVNGNGISPDERQSGKNNNNPKDEANNTPDNNNANMMMHSVKNHLNETTEIARSPSTKNLLVEQANRNRLAAEKAARLLLTRFAATAFDQQVSPSGSENNNCTLSRHHQHHLLTSLSRGSNCSSSNLSNISGESALSLSPCGDDEERQETGSIIAIEKEDIPSEAGNAKNISSTVTPTSSTFRVPFSPNGNGGKDCTSIISSLLPLLGQVHHGGSSPKAGAAVEPSIRHLISTLKSERDAVKQTVMELESGSLESLTPSTKPSSPYNNSAPWSPADARKLDLETAVLMQELMAMKEERAELRAQLFLFEKEKASLELRLRSHESQEEAYRARINYLKSEIMDCKSLHSETYNQDRNRNDIMNSPQPQQRQEHQTQNNGNNRNMVETINNNNNNQNVNWEREVLLKKRIHELATTLEKVTFSSQVREKQNQEMINELNRANGILMQTLDVAKKKYQSRIKKMEDQILYVSERHASQLRLFGERMSCVAKYHA